MTESNLVAHARRELMLIYEEQETIDGYLRVIQAFADMGHSGGSAMVAIPTINRLLQYKPLSALSNDPDEWNHVGEKMWQSSRRPDAFSADGGKTYYLLYLLDDPKRRFRGRKMYTALGPMRQGEN